MFIKLYAKKKKLLNKIETIIQQHTSLPTENVTKMNIKIIGLMLTRDDKVVLKKWLSKYHDWFDIIFCLDGSQRFKNESKALLEEFGVNYYHDDDFRFTKKSDQILRGVVFQKIKTHIQAENDKNAEYWIFIAHPDEFYLTPFPKDIETAKKNNAELIEYNVYHNFPHTSEIELFKEKKDIVELKHFVSTSYMEKRCFKYYDHLQYGDLHSLVIPSNVNRINSEKFRPIYYRYKIQEIDPTYYRTDGVLKCSQWSGLRSHFPENHNFLKVEDFFLEKPSGKYINSNLVHLNDLLKGL